MSDRKECIFHGSYWTEACPWCKPSAQQQSQEEMDLMRIRIEKGDRVRVVFTNGGGEIEGIVDYTPQATGDSWIIVEADGDVVYVQMFEMMRLIHKKGAGEKYHELLYAVATKYPGETRHETALRYIQERECAAALSSAEKGIEQWTT